jgi:hypothetical protein
MAISASQLHPNYRLVTKLNEINDNRQPINATLTAIAALDSTAGLVEQTGADAFTKRALGVGATTSIPTRADADTRYAAKASTILNPAASATPSANGDLVIEWTDDMTLTLKLKGSDGAVRTAVLVLS